MPPAEPPVCAFSSDPEQAAALDENREAQLSLKYVACATLPIAARAPGSTRPSADPGRYMGSARRVVAELRRMRADVARAAAVEPVGFAEVLPA